VRQHFAQRFEYSLAAAHLGQPIVYECGTHCFHAASYAPKPAISVQQVVPKVVLDGMKAQQYCARSAISAADNRGGR
ncbi:MAG: hypothetical protein AAGB25_09370, partial [Pseudomonadota bacterium]